jgi:hypothetical protein
MGLLYDLARMTTLTTGDGASLVLDTAVPSFLSFDDAGVPDGGGVSYAIVDGLHRETGRGLYTTSSKTLTRAVESSTAAGARITLSGSAVVFITALDKDFREWNDNHDANGYNLLMDTGTGIKDDSGNSQLLFTKTASAVNYLNVTNAATGNSPALAPAGSDSNIDLLLTGKGTGYVKAAASAPYKYAGRETIWMPAAAMVDRVTTGAARVKQELTTNKNNLITLDFDTTTQEFAQFEIAMPKSWDRGTLTFEPIWMHGSTTTNFGVVWSLAAVARSNDDPGDVAFGTAQTSTDTGGTTNDIYVGPESSAITVAGSPAVGDTVQFQIARVPADAGDTMAIDAKLIGVRIFFTSNAPTDA